MKRHEIRSAGTALVLPPSPTLPLTGPPESDPHMRTPGRLSRHSKRTLTLPRNIRRPRARCRPVEASVLFSDYHIVDAGFATAHQAVFVELPLLVAVGAVPLPGIVMPFILEAHRDVIVVERPEILDQAILMLPCPFAGEERNDRGAAFKKFGAVAPAASFRIGQRHAFGIARIPGVFGHPGVLRGGLFGKWRERRT